MKSKRAIFNVISNTLNKMTVLAFGVLIPKLYIDYFGSELNGLLSSITGIFIYLNLLEAGVGGAAIQALYAPLLYKDRNKVNGILAATHNYYRRSGIYFLACISVVAFIYPLIINSDIKYGTIVSVILLSASSFALHYFFQGKYGVLLSADNRGYILNLFDMFFITVGNLAKIILIIVGFDVIMVQAAFSFIVCIQVICIIAYVKRNYPGLDLSVKPDNEAISQKKSVLIHQIAGVVFNNTDVLILTFFCGLKIVSVYTIYNMIFSQAGVLPEVFANGLTTSLGQLYVENKNKFKRLFAFFEVYYTMLFFITFIVAYLLILPFIKLYTIGVDDISYIDFELPFLFLIINLLSSARWPAIVMISIAGHFQQTQWRAVIETIMNLVISLALVTSMGMNGVLVGTIAALFFRTLEMIHYSNKNLLFRSSFVQIRRCILNGCIGLVIVIFYHNLYIQISNYWQFLITGCVLFSGVSIIYFGITTLIEKEARLVLFEYGKAFWCNSVKKIN